MKNITVQTMGGLINGIDKPATQVGGSCKRKIKFIIVSRDTYNDRSSQRVMEATSEEEVERMLESGYAMDITSVQIYEVKKLVEFKINIEFAKPKLP